MTITLSGLCFIVAAIVFLIAALPLGVDAPLIAIGLFFFALGHVVRGHVNG